MIFLAAHLLAREKHKQRFLHEAKAPAALDHPNICMIYEIGEADGHVIFAIGYIEGAKVRGRISERPLPLLEALDICTPVTSCGRSCGGLRNPGPGLCW